MCDDFYQTLNHDFLKISKTLTAIKKTNKAEI